MPITARDTTETDLSGILALDNEVIRTSAAVYIAAPRTRGSVRDAER